MTRAIWSAPPPVPAGTMNSTGRVGSQAAAAVAGVIAAAAAPTAAASPQVAIPLNLAEPVMRFLPEEIVAPAGLFCRLSGSPIRHPISPTTIIRYANPQD